MPAHRGCTIILCLSVLDVKLLCLQTHPLMLCCAVDAGTLGPRFSFASWLTFLSPFKNCWRETVRLRQKKGLAPSCLFSFPLSLNSLSHKCVENIISQSMVCLISLCTFYFNIFILMKSNL